MWPLGNFLNFEIGEVLFISEMPWLKFSFHYPYTMARDHLASSSPNYSPSSLPCSWVELVWSTTTDSSPGQQTWGGGSIWEFWGTPSLHPFPCAAFISPCTLPTSLPPVWTTCAPTMGLPEWPSKTQFWPGHSLSSTLQSLPSASRMQAKIHILAETAPDYLLLLLFSISLLTLPTLGLRVPIHKPICDPLL